MINVELDLLQAVSVRTALFNEQKCYTYDETCCPPRISGIRQVIEKLDELIETEVERENSDA